MNPGRRLWPLCSVLRDEGIPARAFVAELGGLLVLRRAGPALPPELRWAALCAAPTEERPARYRRALAALAEGPLDLGPRETALRDPRRPGSPRPGPG